MTLLCDSAYLNEQQNTFQAFGHVNLKRKDGTNVTCQRAFYDGFMQTLRDTRKSCCTSTIQIIKVR